MSLLLLLWLSPRRSSRLHLLSLLVLLLDIDGYQIVVSGESPDLSLGSTLLILNHFTVTLLQTLAIELNDYPTLSRGTRLLDILAFAVLPR